MDSNARNKFMFGTYNEHFWTLFVVPTVLKRDNYQCKKCGSAKRLDVSHNRYGPDITIHDLETLCRSCHWKKDTI